MSKKNKITIIGAGYVGMSMAVLLSQNNDVCLLDKDPAKVNKINLKESPIKDKEIEEYLYNKKLNLIATDIADNAFKNSDYVIIATPTSYNEDSQYFDTSSVEQMVEISLRKSKNALIVIKSTIPIGFIDKLIKKHNTNNIIFSPEFLREGKALFDNLYPSRIIVSSNSIRSRDFANLLAKEAIKKEIPIYLMSTKEAESVKLFANSYLAMRISYFNELDNFAIKNGLDTKNIIEGICSDERIGNFYNNPSFGYGGYCLPKDTKQLLANYKDIPQSIIGAIVESNCKRKEFIVEEIKNIGVKKVGIYRLIMKSCSDNFRSSAVQDIITGLRNLDIEVFIYEPIIEENTFETINIVKDLSLFKEKADLIIANRIDDDILDVIDKIYSRDIFQNN